MAALIEVRDTAVHFYHSEALSYLVYTLGVASLRNYQKLVHIWWGRSLLEYNFYILPLGFSYNFHTLSMLDLDTEPEALAKLWRSVSKTQSLLEKDPDFYFTCEIATKIVTAKKFTDTPDFTTSLDYPGQSETPIVPRTQPLTDKYSLSFHELAGLVRDETPEANNITISQAIKHHKIKQNSLYCSPNFRSNKEQKKFLVTGKMPPSVPFIYNHDAVRHIAALVAQAIADKKSGSQTAHSETPVNETPMSD